MKTQLRTSNIRRDGAVHEVDVYSGEKHIAVMTKDPDADYPQWFVGEGWSLPEGEYGVSLKEVRENAWDSIVENAVEDCLTGGWDDDIQDFNYTANEITLRCHDAIAGETTHRHFVEDTGIEIGIDEFRSEVREFFADFCPE